MTDPADSPAHSDPAPLPGESLPPVQPPTPGFLLQLFVIPALIVLVMFSLVYGCRYLAESETDPMRVVKDMRQNRPNSWQQAYNLTEQLRGDKRYRNDPELAKELAEFLNDLLADPLPPASATTDRRLPDARSEEVARRGFLCKALGEFEISADALPVLLKAAGRHSNEDELRVRLAALESLALLTEHVKGKESLESSGLVPLLLAASEDDDHKIAARATVALASVGSAAAIDRLRAIVSAPHHIDVQYNAALGLARNGNAACVGTLTEMLDVDQQRATADEPDENARRFKRTVILLNALRATRQLAEQDQDTDLSSIEKAVNSLIASTKNDQIRLEATSTLQHLRQRQP